MANPSGTQYLQANPNYIWTDGDVYLIQGGNTGDTTEGAALNASFNGLGVDNQPHQVLLNKINYLKKSLVSTTSNVGTTGWYKLATNDVNLGQINVIEQWGMIPAAQIPPISTNNQANITFSFPLTYTTACWVIIPYVALNSGVQNNQNFSLSMITVVPVAPFAILTNTLLLGFAASNATFQQVVFGVGWRALGY